ncbi:iron-containing alcohol dehydrogenase family protein [Alteribacillus sp. JSM 102045]|uniref:iron-containing alcohol dehydrogenase family protein n=1 Tax=Alteribacillus sp. JSM 102045 TaxID=1562101 RepID=UPI0035C2424F
MSSIYIPVRIEYGTGSSLKVGTEFKTFNCTNVLIITDQGIVSSGLLDKITESLDNKNISNIIYDQVKADPDEECVTNAQNLFIEKNCDGILAVGGGSSIDCAKGAALLATNPEPLMSYAGPDKVKNQLPPLIAIPTTCGTGSEVTNVTVITDENHFKSPFISTLLIPKVAILDPDLLNTLPPNLVASTGMDALTHAIEALTNKVDNWYANACAIQAIRDVKKYIRLATDGDRHALGKILYASTLAGIAFTLSRLGLVHAMSHPISSYAGIPHGTANAILLPYVMSFNLVGTPNVYAQVARELEVKEQQSSINTAAKDGVKEIINLNGELGIPKSFKELGLKESHIPKMIKDTFKSGNIAINPREVTERDVERIYQLSIQGDSPLLLLEEVEI